MDAHDIFQKLTRGAVLKNHKTQSGTYGKNRVASSPVNSLTSVNSKKKKKLSKEKLKAIKAEQIIKLRKQHHISVSGRNIPDPIENFQQLISDYEVSEVLVQNIYSSGYVSPTPIQMQAIPLMLKGFQILACAPTGSGKTAAFLLPILHHLRKPKFSAVRAVIVSPTRELAKQIQRECTRLAEGTGLRSKIIKKANLVTNGAKSFKCDILITTPNRLVYLLKQDPPAISLASVEWFIVDESDKLFETGKQGFRDQLAVIYTACTSTDIKRAMFSATHTPDVAHWAHKNLKDLASVTIGLRNTAAEEVKQELVFVGNESGKLVEFRNLIHQGLKPPVLVFVQSKERAKELFNELIYEGINVDVIHADRTQLQRDNVVRSFREGKIWVLICTELMGRGIDFKGVSLVVNYDFPTSAISYIHRIGRTGRAGNPGRAVTYFTQDDSVNLRSIAQVVRDSGGEIPDYMLTLKKPSKRTRNKLKSKAPARESISTTPVYQKEREEAIKKKIRKRKRNQQESKENSSSNDVPEKKKRRKKLKTSLS